jgi:hypothetical protein
VVAVPIALANPYLSEDLASLRYTQSADVVTIVNQLTSPTNSCGWSRELHLRRDRGF